MPSKNPSSENLPSVPVPTSTEALVEAVAQEKRPVRDTATDTSGAREVTALPNGIKVVRW